MPTYHVFGVGARVLSGHYSVHAADFRVASINCASRHDPAAPTTHMCIAFLFETCSRYAMPRALSSSVLAAQLGSALASSAGHVCLFSCLQV